MCLPELGPWGTRPPATRRAPVPALTSRPGRRPGSDRISTPHAAVSEPLVQAHKRPAAEDTARVAEIEREVDRLAAQLWGITDEELAAIQDALAGNLPEDEVADDDGAE